MRKFLFYILFLGFCFGMQAQVHQDDFEKWPVLEKPINITGISLSPDEKTLAIACSQNQGLILYDWKARSILKRIDLKSESMGYSVDYSSNGNYLILQEKRIETSFKRVKQCDYYILDVNTGNIIHQFKKIADLAISKDEKSFYLLENSEIVQKDIKTGQVLQKKKLEDACNAIAISPDGQDLAVVIKPNKDQVAAVPSVRNNKKAIKANAKNRHMIMIYDANSLEEKRLINEMYDNINLLEYTKNGAKLMCFNVAQNSYVNIVDVKGYEPVREAYLGKSSMQPDFHFDKSMSFFGIATLDQYPAVNVYEAGSGKMLDSFNMKMRIWKNLKNKIYAGTLTSLAFLPEEEAILISYGNALLLWNFKK